MDYYPIAVKLKKKEALVVGGGNVAERKVLSLLAAGADVCVIAPVATRRLASLSKAKKIVWYRRPVRKSDLRRAVVVVAATNNTAVNTNVSRWAKESEVLVNVVDRPSLSDFMSPAVLRRKGAIVTVYTDGKDPVLSRDLKNFLKEKWDDFLSYRDRL